MGTTPSAPTHRILIADHDTACLETYRRCFSREGWSYELLSSGSDALKTCSEQQFDLVITSFHLPELDPLHFLTELRSRNPRQPVLVITGDAIEEVISSLQAGAAEILQRPFDFDSLEQAVIRLLAGKQPKKIQNLLQRALLQESSTAVFHSAEISGTRLPLTIAERLFKVGSIDQTTRLKLELAFQEALTNALEHGNLELQSEWREEINKEGVDRYSEIKRARLAQSHYADRTITISIDCDPTRLTVMIEDQGVGFAAPPSQSIATGTAVHGRGLSLIASSVDEVRFDLGGRRIHMVKFLTTHSIPEGD